jgi:hypothetical protein
LSLIRCDPGVNLAARGPPRRGPESSAAPPRGAGGDGRWTRRGGRRSPTGGEPLLGHAGARAGHQGAIRSGPAPARLSPARPGSPERRGARAWRCYGAGTMRAPRPRPALPPRPPRSPTPASVTRVTAARDGCPRRPGRPGVPY